MITAPDLAEALARMGVGSRDVLWVHSSLARALQMAGDTPGDKVDTILEGLEKAVPDGVLALPTFSYSFARGEEYDMDATPSRVGVLGERFRQRKRVQRTNDPMFSSAIRGELSPLWRRRLFEVRDVNCFGEDGVFAYLREVDAKLLFMGVGFAYCTYIHHLEQRMGVPYRYLKEFRGTVRRGQRRGSVTATYFVRPLEGDVEPYFDPLGDVLLSSGAMGRATLPGGTGLLLASASAVEFEVRRHVSRHPDFLLRRGHSSPVAVGVG